MPSDVPRGPLNRRFTTRRQAATFISGVVLVGCLLLGIPASLLFSGRDRWFFLAGLAVIAVLIVGMIFRVFTAADRKLGP